MRHRIRSAAAVVALGTVAALAPSPASAGVVVESSACATGGFTSFGGELNVAGVPTVRAAGTMRPCPNTTLPGTFIVIHYDANYGWYTPSRIVPFQSATEPTPFSTAGWETSYEASGTVVSVSLPLAICVGTRTGKLADCVRVQRQGAGLPPLVNRIATTDPLVRKPIVVDQKEPTTQGCGTCV